MRWTRSWILCAAFYYPALWLAISCVWSLPGLFHSAFSGEHIVLLRVTPLGLMVLSAPSEPAVHPDAAHFFFASVSPFWILIPLAVAIAIGLIGTSRTRRIVSGLFVAMLADVAMVIPYARFRQPQVSAHLVLSSAFFFAVLCFGLRMMLSGWAGGGYWSRLTGLCAGMSLLSLPLWVIFRWLHLFQFRGLLLVLALPAAAGAILISFWKPSPSPTNLKATTVAPVFSGFAVTILLVAGITFGGPAIMRAFQQRRLAANQAAVANLPPIQVNAPYPKVFFQKGVSFSAEFPDPYASAGARQMLRSLHADGVNAVSLVPYGWMRLGSPEIHGFGQHSWESTEGLLELSRVAHAIGMKVMLKPGMWIQGGYFGGDVHFSSQAERKEWFQQYGKFIDRYARVAREIHADIFCIGGEFVRLSPYTPEWLNIIAGVRKIYPGPLTYAANFGNEFQNLKFWGALDYIGLQEYYPLPNSLSTKALVAKVEAVQKRFHKPVIFTEAGFASSPGTNRHPWENGKQGKVDVQLQAGCYRAIFRAFYNKPWFEGMYWWKVGSNGFGGPDDASLTPWGKPAMTVIRKWYESGDRQNARLNGAAVK